MSASPEGLSDAERIALGYLIDEIRWTRNAARILLGIMIGSGLGFIAAVPVPTANVAALVSGGLAVLSFIGFINYFDRIKPIKNHAQQMIASRLTGEFQASFLAAVEAGMLQKSRKGKA